MPTAMTAEPAATTMLEPVIDPRQSEADEMADVHRAVKPGTDAFCLAAIVAVLVHEQLVPWP